MITCFFIGSRHAGGQLWKPLTQAIERHITEYGVEQFIVGHYGNFDAMAARALCQAKRDHPELSLLLLLPYHPHGSPVAAPPGFDGTYYPEGMEQVPKRLAIVRANRYMVDHSQHLISFAPGVGSSRDLMEYALRREKRGLIRVEQLARAE